MGESDDKI